MPRLDESQQRLQRAATRQALGIDENARVVLGVGYGEVRKGLDLWPLLVRRVSAVCPDVIFLWVGNVEPSLRHWLDHDLRMTGHERRMLMPGHSTDIAGMYAAADAFAMTSREDPFPSVVLEAMASGLPTVVFEDSGGIVDLVREAGGICVPYLDVEEMGRELGRILQDPDRLAEMRSSLSRRINRDFDNSDYVAKLLKLAAPPPLTISVVVPNYNYARHLRQRMDSIWSQTVVVSEIILLDDASTDDSEAVMAALAQESPIPVRFVRNSENSGSVTRQWAKGVALASGDLVWIAEADDFADSDFLSALLPAFEDDEVVLGYCESRMVDEAGKVTAADYLGYVADIDPVRWTADFRSDGQQEIAQALCVKNTIPNVSAVLFRREALSSVLRDDVDELSVYRNAADWLCYIRLLAKGGTLAFVATALNNHRRHARSVTVAATDRRHFEEFVAVQDIAAATVSVPPRLRHIALNYRRDVAKQFGVPLETVA
jgi:glycosyltransferase involved in cell wall biosynthesis